VAEERVQRRLAAIVSADVVGYSRLMGRDEAGTLAGLKALRSDFLHPKVAEYGGRIVKTTGDGTLIEFPSAVDAVQHAIDVQRGLAERNAGVPEDRQVRLRLGVNLGDIIIDGEDIFGDGVNVAARLESIAEPGGICVSGTVYEQVRNRVDTGFEDLGERRFKNIERAVRTYRALLEAPAEAPGAGARGGSVRAERPGIAVLPFANMSGDPEQEYFADGMVEEIITGLARIRWLTVIARNSTFKYKGSSPDVRKVGQELAVRYVLEGSVRKAGNRVRITAQLIEAETGGHLWADRFDGSLADVFDLQDQITTGVVSAIEPSVRQAEIERAKRKRPDNLDAYDLYLRALDQTYTFTPAGRSAALPLLEDAIGLDPNYAEAHGLAAYFLMQRFLWEGRAAADRDAALAHAEAVAASRSDDAVALAFAALVMGALSGSYGPALAMVERALALNPSSASAQIVIALLNCRTGRHDRARAHSEEALRLSPFDPRRHLAETVLASAEIAEGNFEDALAKLQRALAVSPAFLPARILEAACLARLGRPDEASDSLRRVREASPDVRISTFRERTLTVDDVIFDAVVEPLRRIGLPE